MEKNIRITSDCKVLADKVAANIGQETAFCFRAVCRMLNSGRITIDGSTVTIRKFNGQTETIEVPLSLYDRPSECVKIRTFIPLEVEVSALDYRKALAAVLWNAYQGFRQGFTPAEIEGVDYVLDVDSEVER